MTRHAAVVLALCAIGAFVSQAQAVCCYSHCCSDKFQHGFDDVSCGNGYGHCCDNGARVVGTYCGVGSCNIFGCNCDGGCLKNASTSTGTQGGRVLVSSASSTSAAIKAFNAIDTNRDCHISEDEAISFLSHNYDINVNVMKAALSRDFMDDMFKDISSSKYAAAGKILPRHFDRDLAKWKCVPKKA